MKRELINDILQWDVKSCSKVLYYWESEVEFKKNDPVKGEVYRPIEILPPVTIEFSERNLVFVDNQSKSVKIKPRSNKPNIKGVW